MIDVKKAVKSGDIVPNKKLGQCFLTDGGVAGRIVGAADPAPGDHAIEVGPGVCILTGMLCERAGSVTAVEIDKRLAAKIGPAMSGYGNFTLINADILKISPDALLPRDAEGAGSGRRVILVSNMPYYISSRIMARLFTEFDFVDKAVLMMQSELAHKLLSKPSEPDYCMMTVLANSFYKPELLFHVPPHLFTPQPGVESAVVAFCASETPPCAGPEERETYFRVVRAAFSARRKTLENCLIGAGLAQGRGQAACALASARIKSGARGESLGVSEFAALARALRTIK